MATIIMFVQQSCFHHIFLVVGLSFLLQITSLTEADDSILPKVRMDIADDGSCSYILKIPQCGQCNCAEENQAINDLRLRMNDMEGKIRQLIENKEASYWKSTQEIYAYFERFVPGQPEETFSHPFITEEWQDSRRVPLSEIGNVNRPSEPRPTRYDSNFPSHQEDSPDSEINRELRPPGTPVSHTRPALSAEVTTSLEEDGSDTELYFPQIIEETPETITDEDIKLISTDSKIESFHDPLTISIRVPDNETLHPSIENELPLSTGDGQQSTDQTIEKSEKTTSSSLSKILGIPTSPAKLDEAKPGSPQILPDGQTDVGIDNMDTSSTSESLTLNKYQPGPLDLSHSTDTGHKTEIQYSEENKNENHENVTPENKSRPSGEETNAPNADHDIQQSTQIPRSTVSNDYTGNIKETPQNDVFEYLNISTENTVLTVNTDATDSTDYNHEIDIGMDTISVNHTNATMLLLGKNELNRTIPTSHRSEYNNSRQKHHEDSDSKTDGTSNPEENDSNTEVFAPNEDNNEQGKGESMDENTYLPDNAAIYVTGKGLSDNGDRTPGILEVTGNPEEDKHQSSEEHPLGRSHKSNTTPNKTMDNAQPNGSSHNENTSSTISPKDFTEKYQNGDDADFESNNGVVTLSNGDVHAANGDNEYDNGVTRMPPISNNPTNQLTFNHDITENITQTHQSEGTAPPRDYKEHIETETDPSAPNGDNKENGSLKEPVEVVKTTSIPYATVPSNTKTYDDQKLTTKPHLRTTNLQSPESNSSNGTDNASNVDNDDESVSNGDVMEPTKTSGTSHRQDDKKMSYVPTAEETSDPFSQETISLQDKHFDSDVHHITDTRPTIEPAVAEYRKSTSNPAEDLDIAVLDQNEMTLDEPSDIFQSPTVLGNIETEVFGTVDNIPLQWAAEKNPTETSREDLSDGSFQIIGQLDGHDSYNRLPEHDKPTVIALTRTETVVINHDQQLHVLPDDSDANVPRREHDMFVPKHDGNSFIEETDLNQINNKEAYTVEHRMITTTNPRTALQTSTEMIIDEDKADHEDITELGTHGSKQATAMTEDAMFQKATDLPSEEILRYTAKTSSDTNIEVSNVDDNVEDLDKFTATVQTHELYRSTEHTDNQPQESDTTVSQKSQIFTTDVPSITIQTHKSVASATPFVIDSNGGQQQLQVNPTIEEDTWIQTTSIHDKDGIVTTLSKSQRVKTDAFGKLSPTETTHEHMLTFEDHIPTMRTLTTTEQQPHRHSHSPTSKSMHSTIQADSVDIPVSTEETERVSNTGKYDIVQPNATKAASSNPDPSNDLQTMAGVIDNGDGLNPVAGIIPDASAKESSDVLSGKQQTDTIDIIQQSKLHESTQNSSQTISNTRFVTDTMVEYVSDSDTIPETTDQPQVDIGQVPSERISHALVANKSSDTVGVVHQGNLQHVQNFSDSNQDSSVSKGDGNIVIPDNYIEAETTDRPEDHKFDIDAPAESQSHNPLSNHSIDHTGIVEKDKEQPLDTNSTVQPPTPSSWMNNDELLVDPNDSYKYGIEDHVGDGDDNDGKDDDDYKEDGYERDDGDGDYNDKINNEDTNTNHQESEDQTSHVSFELVGGESDVTDWDDISQSSDYTQAVTEFVTPTRQLSTLPTKTPRPLLHGDEPGMYAENKPRWKLFKLNLYPNGYVPDKPHRPTPLAKAVNCMDGCTCLRHKGFTKNGVYSIPNPPLSGKRGRSYSVSCEMRKDGSAWTVIQRRVDAATNFFRPWDRYAHGFGIPDGNFWIGNNFLHAITRRFPYQLRVEFRDWKDKFGYAVYDKFEVFDESRDYRLILGNFIGGNRGDALSYHNNTKFSTKDRDNDVLSDTNCAELRQSGFWFKACNKANPNGRWIGTHEATGLNGGVITWGTWPHHGFTYALKSFKMMIRPVSEVVP